MQRKLVWVLLIVGIIASCVGGTGVGVFVARAGLVPATGAGVPLGEPAMPTLPTATPLPIIEGANELETQISAVYQRVGPGVVNITTRSFEFDFFMRPIPREGSGSGFFYDSNGNIVTNYHVVQDAEELRVTLADGRTMDANIVGTDPSNDLAVLHVDLPPEEISVVSVSNEPQVHVGQFVVAIGNPFGLDRTLTVGVVSSLGRVIESPNQRFIGEIIQTDAPINPGNSGGPLLNLAGEVIGVNSAIFSPSGTSAGIGFAIPAATVQRVVPALIATGRYPHPSLGVQLFELTPDVIRLLRRAGMDVPVEHGLLVIRAYTNMGQQPALRGGQRQVRVGRLLVPVGGDIITAIDGQEVETFRDLIVYLETNTQVGETVQVTVIRDGQEQVVPVTLQELAL
jgi:S1-C subfamily serine protease